MSHVSLDRRRLLQLGGSAWAASMLPGALSSIAQAADQNRTADAFTTLSPELAAALDAIAARLVPTTDTPGAREAGAVWFIDAALGADAAPDLPVIEAGIAELNASAGGDFAALDSARQDELLTLAEGGEFFEAVLFLTLAGTFTMPRYGGNRGEVGWDILGFERRHHWEVPFGHYDAAVHNPAGRDGGAD